jgi:hypothetical protein
VLLAAAWVGPLLPAGHMSLSPDLHEALGRPTEGAAIALCKRTFGTPILTALRCSTLCIQGLLPAWFLN